MRVITLILVGLGFCLGSCSTSIRQPVAASSSTPETWRAERRLIDLHQHINGTSQHMARAVRIMDRVGIGIAVNLSGGVVTGGSNAASPFERNKRLADRLYPGRFLQYMNLDYRDWDEPDFSNRAVNNRPPTINQKTWPKRVKGPERRALSYPLITLRPQGRV
jgi:hypothetical protein